VDHYEAMLEIDDADLIDWIAGRATPDADRDNDVLRLLLAFKYTARPA
jgi:succinate dehydrogenase flavin-adding protein (antitoxin of CptAB toxin-antitoxin module)